MRSPDVFEGNHDNEEEIDFTLEETQKNEITLIRSQELDMLTSQALDIIESSGWVSQSQSSHESSSFDEFIAPTSQQLYWKKEIKSLSEQEMESMFSNTCEETTLDVDASNRTRENSILFNAERQETDRKCH